MNTKKNCSRLLLMAAGVICAASLTVTQAFAETTTTDFGTAPSPTPANPYGGSGIPADTSEWTRTTEIEIPGANIDAGLDTIVLDQAATQYSANAAPGNNGAGTYTVVPGIGNTDTRSTWNFDFNVSDSLDRLDSYTYSLTELNVGNGESFSFDPTSVLLGNNPNTTGSQGNSESLDFGFAGGPISYNINANDTYLFTLTADLNGSPVATDTITVVDGTGAVPDKAATGALMAGIFPLMILAKRRLARPPV